MRTIAECRIAVRTMRLPEDVYAELKVCDVGEPCPREEGEYYYYEANMTITFGSYVSLEEAANAAADFVERKP